MPSSRGSVPLIVMLAVAGVMTTATQLRIGGSPLGPGEALLVLSIVGTAGYFWLSGRADDWRDEDARILLGFWVISAVILMAGYLAREAIGRDDYGTAFHDAPAFALAAVITLLAVRLLRSRAEVETGIAACCAAAAVAAAVLMVSAYGRIGLPGIDPWYASVRFRGWAENPNQMAFLLAPVPFACLQLARSTTSRARRIGLSLCMLSSLAAGVATASDALFVAWLMGLIAYWSLAAVDFARQPLQSPLLGVALMILVPATVGLGLFYIGSDLVDFSLELMRGTYDVGGQGSTRLVLWEHALEALQRSPVVGLGPGSFSGYFGPFEGQESHNSVIEWVTATGALGLLAMIVLAWRVLDATLGPQRRLLLAAALSLAAFSMFHFVLRQPLFWLWVVLLLRYGRELPESRIAPAAQSRDTR